MCFDYCLLKICDGESSKQRSKSQVLKNYYDTEFIEDDEEEEEEK